jgi:DNA polymerase I
VRGFAERVAMNTPIQGTSADIIKKAMLDVASGLLQRSLKSRLLLQIHDELLFETPEAEVEAAASWVREVMENAVRLSVPLTVGVKAGPNWQDLKELRAPALQPGS